MKALLIDDKANKGWLALLKKVFPVNGIKFYAVTDVTSAVNKLREKYDIIFLDVRLERKDHYHVDVKEYSGFEILESIKNDFLNPNFSTPIMLITASNKIWNINAFMEYGVDAYYIKEHPNNVFDKETSESKYYNLRNDFNRLCALSYKRGMIWNYSKEIIIAINNHIYFNDTSGYKNVKERIIDKLKLGYYYGHKGQISLEQNVLKVDNVSIAFLIYFSILEELVKGYTERSTWDEVSGFSGNWKFRNNSYFIYKNDNVFEVEPFWDSNTKKLIKKEFGHDNDKYNKGHINLSEQVHALLFHYEIDKDYSRSFNSLNMARNRLSYTHSSIESIYNSPLVETDNQDELGKSIVKILKLIREILNYPV